MTTLEAFCRSLYARLVPYYAYPRFLPEEAPDFFTFGKIERLRKLTGFSPREEMVVISSALQVKNWKRFLKITSVPEAVIVISSEVTDLLALQAAALLNWSWINNFPATEWKWFTPSYTVPEVNRDMKFMFIRSILPNKDQAYAILDLINKHPRALKVLAIGGMQGLEYTDTFLHIPVHAAFHIEGTKEKLPSAIRIRSSVDVECKVPAVSYEWPGAPLLSSSLPSLRVLRKGDRFNPTMLKGEK